MRYVSCRESSLLETDAPEVSTTDSLGFHGTGKAVLLNRVKRAELTRIYFCPPFAYGSTMLM